VLPPGVTGYFLLLLLGRKGWLGAWLADTFGIYLAFEFAGAVIAAAVMSFPLLVRSLRLAIELVDPGLETAAATLGARPLRVFFSVTLPLALPGLITGMVLAFARGLGEFGATITVAGNIAGETRTLPLAVYSYMQTPGRENDVLWLSLIAVGLSAGALLASEWWARRLERRVRGGS
jgi:molybdate transport system permease protein